MTVLLHEFDSVGPAAERQREADGNLFAYGLANLPVFAARPAATDDRERDLLENLKGLFHRSSFAALAIGIALLST